VLGGYVPAPRKANHGDVPGTAASVFRCPSGQRSVYEFNPASRDDAEGGKAYPFKSESSGTKFYVDCWYGVNGGLGSSEKYPFARLPGDEGSRVPNRLNRINTPSQTVGIFDGWWILNGKDERIHARHTKGTRSNLLFFDGSARNYPTFRIPSVDQTNQAEIIWKL
jgi:prepilin-type processing-associated H-X9-DG protein